MANVRAYIHWSLSDLQALRAAAITAESAGVNRFTVQTISGDVSVTKEATMPWGEWWAAVNYALESKAPSTYTPRRTRTRVQFS